ncbi:MAG: cellulose biosynthesis protein BcsS [Roseiarcus sp.]
MSVFALTVSYCAARGDEARDLVYFSGELLSGRSGAGPGWLHAPAGLDSSGPILAVALGGQQPDRAYGQLEAGWRFSRDGFAATWTGGVEAGTANAACLRPSASADVWWEPSPGWMTAALVHATTEYVSWRVSAGLKPAELWPWIGPEAGSSAEAPRAGVHATGLRLWQGFEARASMGISWRRGEHGPYGELAIWRRF